MADPARSTATYDDVVAAPDHLVAELIDGELHLSPRPSSPQALAASALGADLHVRFGRRGGDGPGGWWLLYEPELHLGAYDPRARVLVPDLAGWRRERMPEIPRVSGFELAPDWVCARCSPPHPPPIGATGSSSSRSTPNAASGTSGSSIRTRARSRCCACTETPTCWRSCSKETAPSAPSRSRPSR